MIDDNNHINYSAADIEKYWRGELSAAEQHAMEKAALEDPFLADAMEGYEEKAQVVQPVMTADNNELRKRLAGRVAEKQSARVIKYGWWKVAAVVIVLIGAGWLYNGINNKVLQQTVATNKITKEPPVIVKTDTINTAAGSDSNMLQDLAVTKSPHAAVKDNRSFKKEKDKEAETAIAPSVTAGQPAAVKPGAAQSADSISSDKKDVAKQMERKEELSKSFDVAQPEQRAKSISADDDNANRNALASRSNNFSNTFIGNVRNQSNQPVANTFVQIPNLNVATKTDKKGYFSFEAPDTALSVSIAADGFETQNLSLRNKAMLNQITLKPVQNVLREVVVQSNGAEKKKQSVSNDISIKILDAEPVNGWTEYNAYLEKNKKVNAENKNIHGTVIISFEVHSKWINNFTIVQSLDEDLDAEAIRLIKEGPAWKLLKGKKAMATVTVRF